MNATTHAAPGMSIESSTSLQMVEESRAQLWGTRLMIFVVATWAASLAFGFQVGLIVLTVVGFAAAALGLRRPALGLFGIGILSTIDAPTSALLLTGGVLRWNTFNYWLLLVMLLALPFLLRLKDPQTRLLQAFIILLGLQLFVSPSRTAGLQQVLNIVTVFGLLVYFAANVRDRHVWYWFSMVCGITAGAGGLAFFLQVNRLPEVNANAWALFPLTGLFAVCLGFPFAAQRRRLTLALVAIVNLALVNFVWLALSASRGALLIAVFCLVFLVLEMRSLVHRVVFVLVGIVLVVVISTQFPQLQAHVLKRINLLVDPNATVTERTSGRFDIALGGWHIFLRNPLGVGTGGFASEWAKLGNLGGLLITRRAGLQRSAHSGWVKVLAENGIVGIVLLFAFVLSFAVVGWSRGRRDRTLRSLGLLATVTFAVALISFEFQNKGLWLLAAGVMTLLHRDAITRDLEAFAGRSRAPEKAALGVWRG